MIIEVIVCIIISFAILGFIKLNYRKCETEAEKILFILYVITCTTPVFIYFLDLWNIPTKMNLTDNIDSQNWLAFLANYTSSIVSSIIGITVSIYLVFLQIRKNNEDTEKRDKENLRLQNMPLLKYSLNTYEQVLDESDDLIVTRFDKGKPYKLSMLIKNIGLNNIKKVRVDFQSDILKNNIQRLIGKDTIVVMEKNEEIKIKKYFSLPNSNEPYKITSIVSYQDVLSNWYKQILQIYYTATNEVGGSGPVGMVEYIVQEEELIDNEAIENYITK